MLFTARYFFNRYFDVLDFYDLVEFFCLGGLVNRKKNHSYGDITHCRLRAVFFFFYTRNIQQWGFFSVSHLRLHRGHLGGPLILIPVADSLTMDKSQPFFIRLTSVANENRIPITNIWSKNSINWQNIASLACLYRYLYDYKISQRLKQHTLNIHQQLTTRQQKPAHSLREQQRTRICRQRWLHLH